MNDFNQKLQHRSNSYVDKILTRVRRRSAFYRFERLRQLPKKSIIDAFPDAENTRCVIDYSSAINSVLGNIDASELTTLSALCAYLSPETIFEFGTFDGRTTLHLALNSPPSARVITVDLHPDDPIRSIASDDTFYTGNVVVGHHFRGTDAEKKIEQIYSDTTKYDHSALKNKVGMVFVDAGHTYELARSDSKKALEMVRSGGVVLWHDYSFGHPGVYNWLHELSQSIPLINLVGTSLVCHVRE